MEILSFVLCDTPAKCIEQILVPVIFISNNVDDVEVLFTSTYSPISTWGKKVGQAERMGEESGIISFSLWSKSTYALSNVSLCPESACAHIGLIPMAHSTVVSHAYAWDEAAPRIVDKEN